MPPPLRLCVCLYLLATCSARPSWHKSLVVVKDHDLPAPLAQSEYSEAQIAAAQAIRDAEEDTRLHLAMMKKKYMDLVRHHFYNTFAPLPFVKERLDDFEPNLHSEYVLPVKIISPQPLNIHYTAGNPCSGNILNCLHANSLTRLGKIVPPPSVGRQPCFGPNCNHVFFNLHLNPMVIPKPALTSHSENKNPSKQPHLHHRICDRKQPYQNCNHRGTFWPTYATVKINTKLYPTTTTYSPKEINHQNSLPPFPTPSEAHVTKEFQQHLILPSNIFNTPTNPTSAHSNNDKKIYIETLKTNASKLENEILGIPEDVRPNSGTQSINTFTKIIQSPSETNNVFLTESMPSTLSVNPNPSTFQTSTGYNFELKKDFENIPPLKPHKNFIHTTPIFSFHTNDVIETLTHETTKPTEISDKSIDEEKKVSMVFQTTTESNSGGNSKLVHEADPSIRDEISTENTSVPIKNAMLDSVTFSSLKELKDLVTETNLVNEEDNARATMRNSFNNRIGVEETEDSTSFPGDMKLEFKPTAFDQNSNWKSEIELITTVEPLPEYSSTSTHYDQKGLVTNVNNNQQTKTGTEYFSEDGTSKKSALTIQTTFRTVQDLTQNTAGYSIDLGREDTTVDTVGSETTGNNGIDSQNISEENTTPVILFINSDNYKVFEETTLEPISDFSVGLKDNFVSITESSVSLSLNKNIDTEDNQEAREETFTDSYKTDPYSSVELDVFQQTQSGLEEIKALSTQFHDSNKSGVHLITTEVSMEPVSGFPLGLRDSLLSTTQSSVVLSLNQNIGTKDNQEAREDTSTDYYLTDPYSTADLDQFQSTQKRLEEGISAFSTQLPNSSKSEVILRTTEDFTDSTETNSAADLINIEISTQNNFFSEPSFLARENVQETVTNQESSSDFKVKQLDFITSEEVHTSDYASTRAQTESNYFEETTEGKESKINWEEEQNLFQSTMKTMEEWTTEKAEITEYFPLAREELSQDNNHPFYNVEETTLDRTPALGIGLPYLTKSSTPTDYGIVEGETTESLVKLIEVNADTTTLLNDFKDNLNQLSSLMENEEIFSTPKSSSEIFILTDEIENPGSSTSHTSIDDKEDITTENRLNGLPQSREGGEEDPHETQVLLEITSETSTDKEITDSQEEKTTSITITENNHDKGMKDIIVTEVTENPELRENIHDSSLVSITTMIAHTETVQTESELNNDTMKNTTAGTEEKSFESNLIIPEELFGKTDTPGLIISGDWTEEQTKDTSLNTLTEFTASVRSESVPTEYPQLKLDEEEYISEFVPQFSATEITNVGVTEDIEPIDLKLDKSTQNVEAATVSYHQSFVPETFVRSALENTEETTSVKPLNENPSLHSYQSGVLKFTTDIETTTEDVLSTEVTEGSVNPELMLKLDDSLNRKTRSVQHNKDKINLYPTTDCILCFLGLPHGHRMKRSSENTSYTTVTDKTKTNNETNVLQIEKSNNVFSTKLKVENPENSSFHASTVELLALLREGYRNNAFSEEDKKVIRSLFGNMKALMDGDTFERITESNSHLLMGDGASRIDEITEEIDYDSSEDEKSENIRLKRSKKNFQIMNDLLKKIPNNLKSHFNIPSQLKNSRVVRSTHMSQVEASAILALLTEKSEAVQLDVPDDEDDDEYEYYEDEGDDYGDEGSFVDAYEDEYNEPSFGELIKLARKHRERKARAEQS